MKDQTAPSLMRKVLVVEDEPGVMRSTVLLLEDLGYEVATCPRADLIHEAVVAECPDVVLQDVRMPGLDLKAMMVRLRKDHRTRDTPILLCTAGLDAQEVARDVQAGGVVEKPYTPQELRSAIEHVLAAAAG